MNDYVLTYTEACEIRDKERAEKTGKIIMPQNGFQERVLTSPADILIIGGERGGGKAQPYDAKVLTNTGFKNMGDVKVGMRILNPNGAFQEILQIHEQGLQDVYRIHFKDGCTTECTLDHLWLVKDKLVSLIYNRRSRYNFLEKEHIKLYTTKQIFDFLDKKNSLKNIPYEEKKNYRFYNANLHIPLCEKLYYNMGYEDKNVKIHPYVLGAIIGGGCIGLPDYDDVNLRALDERIRNRIESLGYETQFRDGKGIKLKKRDLLRRLRFFDLLKKNAKNQFIPNHYKMASVEDRIELLRGLFDTRGYTDNKEGVFMYKTHGKQLAEDVKFIIYSLGGKTRPIHEYTRKGKIEYQVWIFIDCINDLYTLPEKKGNPVEKKRHSFDNNRQITSYEYVGKKPCRCISVNNPNGLYITDDFIVTHNTYSLLLQPLLDAPKKNFSGVIIRREKDDIKRGGGLIETSKIVYDEIGSFGKTESEWEFLWGSKLKFEHMALEQDADRRFRGQQIPFIGIDEINQIKEETFWFLLSSNRNSFGIKNRIVGTCNPDGESWVFKLIKYWIGEDGYPIKNRDGVLRYFYKYGETIDDIIWGNSKEEVYRKAKHYIDKVYREELQGMASKYNLIKSITFIRGRVEENPILLESDPNYIGSIAQGGEAKVAKELLGNWNTFDSKEEVISASEMRSIFENHYQDTGEMWMTIDVAMEGGDKFIICVWNGWHLFEFVIMKNVNGLDIFNLIKKTAKTYRVPNHRIIYDGIGVGNFLGSKNQKGGFIPGSIAYFSNGMAKDNHTFYNLNAEITNEFIIRVKEKKMSINSDILERIFEGETLEEHILRERKAIRWIPKSEKMRLIPKYDAKKIIGHSPDFMDAIKMRAYGEYKKKNINYIQYIY
jgi:hypothetical protein